MWGKTLMVVLSSLAVGVTTFCVQKEKGNSRHVSSGNEVIGEDQLISMNTEVGQWILAKSTPGEPANQTFITIYFKCRGDTEQNIYDEKPIGIYTGSDRLPDRAYSWGEVKDLAVKVYNNHEGHKKPQSVASVIWIKYFTAPEYNFSEEGKPKAEQTEKMVVLDLAEVCR